MSINTDSELFIGWVSHCELVVCQFVLFKCVLCNRLLECMHCFIVHYPQPPDSVSLLGVVPVT